MTNFFPHKYYIKQNQFLSIDFKPEPGQQWLLMFVIVSIGTPLLEAPKLPRAMALDWMGRAERNPGPTGSSGWSAGTWLGNQGRCFLGLKWESFKGKS